MDKEYGVLNQQKISNDFELHLEEFRLLGYTIIEEVLLEDELDLLRSELQRVYTAQEQEFTKENLQLINEEHMARAPLQMSEAYLKLAANEAMMPYIKAILGDYFVLHLQNGIINMPKEEHHQSSWHRDFPYQNWVCSEPLGCNLFYCIDAFNQETGATFVLPYSHKMVQIPSKEYVKNHAVQIKAEPGSVVLFDSMLFHKAGYNYSDQIRRGVNHVYVKSIIRQQLDLPSMLEGKYSDDPFLNMLLGYDAQTSSSVNAFRNRRVNKLKK